MLSDNDPEGLFTNLSAFLNGYVGYRYTLTMFDHKANRNKILFLWAIFAAILAAMVYPLTILMPLNKKIWSISFVFLTAAASGIFLVLITYLFDILGKKHEGYGKIVNIITMPSIWLGRNPLAVFVMM
jgi:heparan-alpha-glucosaminide N-acetyltransferase